MVKLGHDFEKFSVVIIIRLIITKYQLHKGQWIYIFQLTNFDYFPISIVTTKKFVQRPDLLPSNTEDTSGEEIEYPSGAPERAYVCIWFVIDFAFFVMFVLVFVSLRFVVRGLVSLCLLIIQFTADHLVS